MIMKRDFQNSNIKIKILSVALMLFIPVIFSHPLSGQFNEEDEMPQNKIEKNNQSLVESVPAPEQNKQKMFEWEYATPERVGFSSEKINSLISLHKKKKTKKLLIIKDDKIICEWYAPGSEDSVNRHYTASLAKALVGGMSLLVALNDQLIFPDAPACNYIPQWKQDGRKSKITIRHLATHTSGLENAEISLEEQKIMQEKGLNRHMDLAGWKGQFWRQDPDPFSVSRDSAKVIFIPGSRYDYSNPGIGMLTYAVTSAIKDTKYKDIRQLLKERVYMPIGLNDSDWDIGYGKSFEIDGLNLVPSWGGGGFTAHGVARLGRLMLQKGYWQSEQLIDSTWVERVIRYQGTALASDNPEVFIGNQQIHNPVPATTLGWYSNNLGTWKHVPRDAFAGAGAGNQVLLVIPSLQMIIVRNGGNLFDESKGEGFWYGLEKYLFNPVMDAVEAPPYPQSTLIKDVVFAPQKEIIRMAEGSDNWPVTWADDDMLYTAYGDGFGFSPFTDIKLSLGLAKIEGDVPSISGTNIRTNSGEKVGQGAHGPKASGMLMVDNVLYMLVRNMDNAQLGWSYDHGKKWGWADWSFKESFGAPVFLNYGKNYADARDGYVYLYSHDDASAYKSADHMVMARVEKNKIKDWTEYEYYAGFDEEGQPKWTEDVRKRKPVFSNPGKCYRSGISYNQGLKRYIWCQIMDKPSLQNYKGPRFEGGLGIFEAPEPWGPWSTVYYDLDWDVGPGETGSIPTKWISDDGKTCYYLFSGDDFLSVRKMEFLLY